MKYYLCLLLILLPITVLADQIRFEDLLDYLRQSGAAEFSYEEIRTLELASLPWQGQGRMLSSVDGSLVKLQLQPKRIIMVSTPARLYYWDPEQQQRHSLSVGNVEPAIAQITLFRAIIQGHTTDLLSTYTFIPEKHGKHWTLRMMPKPGLNNKDLPSMDLSGDENSNKRRLLIRQTDGESTEYRLVKISESPEVEKTIQHLLLEAVGD